MSNISYHVVAPEHAGNARLECELLGVPGGSVQVEHAHLHAYELHLSAANIDANATVCLLHPCRP